MENDNTAQAIIDRLSQRNVSDKEIDELLDKANSTGGISKEQLGKIQSMASAKKGNKVIEYDNPIMSPEEISAKIEDVRDKKDLLEKRKELKKITNKLKENREKPRSQNQESTQQNGLNAMQLANLRGKSM